MPTRNDAIIRPATLADIPMLLSMGRRFVAETTLPLTFDENVCKTTFQWILSNEQAILLVEEDEGILTGGVFGVVDRDFCKEHCASIYKLYVEKQLRGLGTANALVEAFNAEAKRRGASLIIAGSAGMDSRMESLHANLFMRYGYTVVGRVLIKEL